MNTAAVHEMIPGDPLEVEVVDGTEEEILLVPPTLHSTITSPTSAESPQPSLEPSPQPVPDPTTLPSTSTYSASGLEETSTVHAPSNSRSPSVMTGGTAGRNSGNKSKGMLGLIRRKRAGVTRSITKYMKNKRETERETKIKTLEVEFLKAQNESRRIALQELQMNAVISCLNKTVDVLNAVLQREQPLKPPMSDR